jgi:hypothetical protein
MALQLFKIADVTVASPQSTIEFTSIPTGYTDLIIKLNGRSSLGQIYGGGTLRFNGDSAQNKYETRRVYGSGSAVDSSTWVNGSDSDGIKGWNVVGNNSTASTFSSNEFYIPNYRGSTNKSVSLDEVTENNATTSYAGIFAAIWKDTSAITSVAIVSNSGTTFSTNSTATLYGVL